jgi:hypothetical protein
MNINHHYGGNMVEEQETIGFLENTGNPVEEWTLSSYPADIWQEL